MNSIRVEQGLRLTFDKKRGLRVWYFYAEIWAFSTFLVT